MTDDEDEKPAAGPAAVKDADDEFDDISQKDDGYIKLVLRVLARMCDGQHAGLQASRLSVCLSLSLSQCLSVCLSVCLFVCLSFCLSVCLSLFLSAALTRLMFSL